MKITHLAGFTIPALLLFKHQAKSDLNVELYPASANDIDNTIYHQVAFEEVLGLIDDSTDILHLHGFSTLSFLNTSNQDYSSELVSKAKKQKVKLVFSAYGEENRIKSNELNKFLENTFDHIFVSVPDSIYLLNEIKKTSWVNPGLSSEILEASEKRDINDRPLRLIQILRESYKDESSTLTKQLKDLIAEEKIQLSELKIDNQTNLGSIMQAFRTADVFIDNLIRPYSYFSMLAMGAGAVALGYNPTEISQKTPVLSLSQIVNTDENTVKDKLISLIKQPKSVSDLSERSFNFANFNLRIEISAAEIKKTYQELLKSQ
ncbi:MAG: hypothetical protein KDD56_02775 [Bdellovibrionales bacterium]|nr:hypothetical protein [Bdellovibrionales bacterium]